MNQLPELHSDELSLLQLLDAGFYSSQGSNNLIGQDANLGSMNWFNQPTINSNKPTNCQDEIFSDTESFTSSGSSVPSPGMIDNTEQQFAVQDDELTELSVKELNLKLKGQSKDFVKAVKKRRRTLKNRGYAHSCRMKRIEEKTDLVQNKEELESKIAELEKQITAVKSERDQYKRCYTDLVRRVMSKQRGYMAGQRNNSRLT
ncbi:transcription factor MafK-like [Dendronephthya gigantea]|uniref:transcription factor MafK-like n=1 Tax=Dendronephthya gigantea TaxID=151771 RepID=UPI00106AFE26|nr:transcription factor MafK-like [Dendronephthya gigantea]